MIRTAVVGYGYSAKTFHLPFIESNTSFVWSALVSRKPPTDLVVDSRVRCVSTLQGLNAEYIDLVVITTPNECHFEQAKYCLERGMHVVLEKPMVVTFEQAKRLIALSEKTGRQLFVFQNRRWDGDFLTLRRLIHNQSVGQVKRLTSRFDRFRPQVRDRWREQPGQGVGMLWDLGPHLIDQSIALFGKPNSITARLGVMREQASVDDHFDIWLDYDDIQVTLGSSSFQAGPNQRFVLEGDKGTYVKYGLDVQESDLKINRALNDPRWGKEEDVSWGVLYLETGHATVETEPGRYGDFWQRVSNSIAQQEEPPVPLSEAQLVIEIIELAHQSAVTGQTLSIR